MPETATSILSKPILDTIDLIANCATWQEWTQSVGAEDAKRRLFLHEPAVGSAGFPAIGNIPYAVVGFGGEQSVTRGGYYFGTIRIRFVARVPQQWHRDNATTNQNADRVSPIIWFLNRIGDIVGEMWTLSENGGYQVVQDPVTVSNAMRNEEEANDDILDILIEYRAGVGSG